VERKVERMDFTSTGFRLEYVDTCNCYLWEVIMGMRVGYARVSTVGQKLDV